MATILQNHHVLAVRDVRRSTAFYVESLGFSIVAEPAGWIFVAKDDCTIMLGECPADLPAADLGSHSYFAYLRVDDVNGYEAQLQQKGAELLSAAQDMPWGMREFGIRTPDGHRIMIGQTLSATVTPVPAGYHSICPYLVVNGAERLIEFTQRAFGAAVVRRTMRGSLVGHAEVQIGDSRVMLADAHAQAPARLGMVHLYIADVDAVYQRACEAGATPITPPANMFYGDRSGGVSDPVGNQWWISTHIEDVNDEEIRRRTAEKQD